MSIHFDSYQNNDKDVEQDNNSDRNNDDEYKKPGINHLYGLKRFPFYGSMVLAVTKTKIRIAMLMQKGQWADDEYFFGDLSI